MAATMAPVSSPISLGALQSALWATLQADLNPPPIGRVESIQDIINTVKSLKEKTGAGDTGILIGYGYDADMLKEKRHPNAADLDSAFPDNPVILKHASGHMLVANTAALKMAGVSAATKDPQGGTIIRKKGSQEPDGLVQEQAMIPFVPMMNKPLPWDVEMKKLKIQIILVDVVQIPVNQSKWTNSTENLTPYPDYPPPFFSSLRPF